MEDQKPKRKYTRRKAKVEPLAVYAVMVTVTRGRKTETIYAESTRVEDGCLVICSLDGPQPLVERVRYIPLGSAEITVCARPQPAWQDVAAYRSPQQGQRLLTREYLQEAASGPRIEPGPLEIARQREAQGPIARPRPQGNLVEKNADGIAVVTAGFLDGSPT
jgi:hypothetical protein